MLLISVAAMAPSCRALGAAEQGSEQQASKSTHGQESTGSSMTLSVDVVLVGMRKRRQTIWARQLQKELNVPFVDLDHVYEAKHGKIMDTVQRLANLPRARG